MTHWYKGVITVSSYGSVVNLGSPNFMSHTVFSTSIVCDWHASVPGLPSRPLFSSGSKSSISPFRYTQVYFSTSNPSRVITTGSVPEKESGATSLTQEILTLVLEKTYLDFKNRIRFGLFLTLFLTYSRYLLRLSNTPTIWTSLIPKTEPTSQLQILSYSNQLCSCRCA